MRRCRLSTRRSKAYLWGGVKLEILEHTKKYKDITINGINFRLVQIFILDNLIEIVDSWSGLTIGKIYKEDIKTISIS